MGYRHKAKRINLTFEEPHEYAGLEVTLRPTTLGEYLDLIGLGEIDKSGIADQLHRFAHSLISWNLEDEETGEPVPATAEAVFAQEQDFMLKLAAAWMDALAGVSDPLEQSSPNGEPSLEASIPMETLSSSLVS